MKTDSNTESEEIRVGASEADSAIRFIYRPRRNAVSVVANTTIGYVSAELTKCVELKPTPWTGGKILVTDNGIDVALKESDCEEVIA